MAWEKGVSGNPKGRPPLKTGVTSCLRKLSEQKIEGDDKTRMERLAELMWKQAVEDGDQRMQTYICDRLDGKPLETVQQDTVQQTTVRLVAIGEEVDMQGNALPLAVNQVADDRSPDLLPEPAALTESGMEHVMRKENAKASMAGVSPLKGTGHLYNNVMTTTEKW